MEPLKLAALDEEDLNILSAHAQDALMLVGDIEYHPARKQFLVPMNRFVWERKGGLFSRQNERRRALLSFDRVLAMRSTGVRRDRPQDVLSLLTISFVPAREAPAGTVELVFSGTAAIQLDVECIEAGLADLGPAWDVPFRPVHG